MRTLRLLLPATLSDTPDHFGRLAGSLPASTLLGGLGGAACWTWINAHAKNATIRSAGMALLSLAVLYSAVRVARDYFVYWPQTPNYLGTFDFPERIQAEAVNHSPQTTTYISPSDYGRSMFAFFWEDQPRAQSFDGRHCTVGPVLAVQDTAWIVNVLPLEDSQTAARLAALYPQLNAEVLLVENGTPVVTRFTVPAGTRAIAPAGLVGEFGDFVALRALQTDNVLTPGAQLRAQLTWAVTAATTDDWTVGFYLLDAGGALRAQDDRRPCNHSYPTTVWQPGEIIVEERTLDIPPDLAPGEYTLALAFYQVENGTRAPVSGPEVAPGETLLRAQRLDVPHQRGSRKTGM